MDRLTNADSRWDTKPSREVQAPGHAQDPAHDHWNSNETNSAKRVLGHGVQRN
jgi:hypothetical protein